MATEIVTLHYPAPRTPDVLNLRIEAEQPLRPMQMLIAIGEAVDKSYGALEWSHWTWDGTLPDADPA